MGATRLLFVDGYNVLHAWQRAAGSPRRELDRQTIIDAVRAIVDAEPVDATVVFDGRTDRTETDVADSGKGVRVVFAGTGLTADGAIEKQVTSLARMHPCIVATADRMERETALAAGAECITPEELARWAEHCRQRVRRRPPGGASFENKLPL